MAAAATDPVALAQALIRCPSVTPAEAGALSVLEEALAPAGFAVHRLTFSAPGTADVENLYARIGTAAPNLCFAGHTDVVPPGDRAKWTLPPFAAEIRDGLLYGCGAVDMKGAIACFVAAALRCLEATGGPPPGSISLLITGDEEGPSINGTAKVLDWLQARGERLDACVVGEPSNPRAIGDEIKIGRRGSLNGELVVDGKQGHAAYPHLAENPIPKLARIIDRLSTTPLDAGTADFEPSSLEVTVISVPNTATNVIPSEARALFNIRYNDLHRRPDVEAWVKAQCAVAADEVGARWSVGFSGTGDVFLTRPGPLVDTMTEAVQAVTGRTPRLSTGGGTSDARFIQAVCPVIEFGLVNETIHQVDERVPLADLALLTDVYARFIAGFFARSRDSLGRICSLPPTRVPDSRQRGLPGTQGVGWRIQLAPCVRPIDVRALRTIEQVRPAAHNAGYAAAFCSPGSRGRGAGERALRACRPSPPGNRFEAHRRGLPDELLDGGTGQAAQVDPIAPLQGAARGGAHPLRAPRHRGREHAQVRGDRRQVSRCAAGHPEGGCGMRWRIRAGLTALFYPSPI